MNHYKTYIKWRAKDLEPSDPKSLEEFCAKFNLSVEDIKTFHSQPTFEDDIRKAAFSWLQLKLPELLHLAYRQAKESRSVPDIERLVNISHDLKKKDMAQNNQFNFFNIPDEKIKQIAARYTAK